MGKTFSRPFSHITPFRANFSGITKNSPTDNFSIGEFALKVIKKIRRGRDSNSRYGFPYAVFPGLCLKPLGHLSKIGVRSDDYLFIIAKKEAEGKDFVEISV